VLLFGPERSNRMMELHNLFCSPNIIRVSRSRGIRWAGPVAWTGKLRNSYIIYLSRKTERFTSFVRPRRTLEDDIQTDIKED
jgi:hypothetical protein